jgi:hypothetical protein
LALGSVGLAIGLSPDHIALNVFQVQDGIASLFTIERSGLGLAQTIFAALCLANPKHIVLRRKFL